MEANRDHSVVFEIASKYCISESFVGYDGYSISSEGFLPTIVDIMRMGNGKPLQYSCLENPMNSMKGQNDRILKEKLPRLVGAQCAIGEEWRNSSRRNEDAEPKQNKCPVVDVTGEGSKV